MPDSTQDQWTQWLLHRRHGGDPEALTACAAGLASVRDQVLHNARIADGETVLDVGAGDGLIAFGALERVGTHGTVIFSDISQDLLDHCQALAQELGVHDRCQFLRAPAEDLTALDDASVDVVTTRSVLIYVTAKQQAFNEFYRVLKPGGRLSIYEPINRFGCPEPSKTFWGYDVTPISDLADKVQAVYHRHQPPQTNPMLDFDERDLLTFAEQAGFGEIHLELTVEIGPGSLFTPSHRWEVAVRTAPNPLAPTLEEAMREGLTPAEVERFAAYLRPLVEQGKGTRRSAGARLWAVKG